MIIVSVNCSNNNKDTCLEKSVQCFIDPCLLSECPNFPTAVCRANYCGGCNSEFFQAGQVVDCHATLPIV
ncbi:Hypothetical predicted protein [Mytilus galloprovincialis]|uniref:Uncharacterized protein n=1 Tax=Mytilus galloprovincialis TaxID=29158 RepID=A0A8B6GEW4_MYTGA|nr:Hypothetical predicted protein [Mytilus galloprovincialis]